MQAKPIVTPGMAVSDGAGVKLKRLIGTPALDMADPFLLLDEFKSENPDDYAAGFPPHPHRGFCTLTYMVAGEFEHRDSRGNVGQLGSGSVQWMKAGRGIIHSEMPKMKDGLLWGYQLWINLPASQKMVEPEYQDIQGPQIPEFEDADFKVRMIAGNLLKLKAHAQPAEGTPANRAESIKGALKAPMDLQYFDVLLKTIAPFAYNESKKTTILHVMQGSIQVRIGQDEYNLPEGHLLSCQEQSLQISGPGRFLLISAPALREPVARGGPFVMNTREEIQQAFSDMQTGRLA